MRIWLALAAPAWNRVGPFRWALSIWLAIGVRLVYRGVGRFSRFLPIDNSLYRCSVLYGIVRPPRWGLLTYEGEISPYSGSGFANVRALFGFSTRILLRASLLKPRARILETVWARM